MFLYFLLFVYFVLSKQNEFTLVHSNVSPTEEKSAFGCSVSMSNNKIAVGARLEGAVYIFDLNDVSSFEKINGVPGFGSSVDLKNNMLVIGSPDETSYLGKVYIYKLVNGNWTLKQEIVPNDAIMDPITLFGSSLSLDGNTLAVGGHKDDHGHGGAWIFDNVNGIWTQNGKKLVGQNSLDSRQGSSVKLSGDILLIGGAAYNDYKGTIWVFQRSNNTWVEVLPQINPTTLTGLYPCFGESIAMNNDILISGAYGEDYYDGAVSVFTRHKDMWLEYPNKLKCSDADPRSRQGHSVSISSNGKNILIGIPGDGVGSACVFTQTKDGTWNQFGNKFLVNDSVPGNYYHVDFSVSISPNGMNAVIGNGQHNFFKGGIWIYKRK